MSKRPYKVQYMSSGRKVGRIASCATPEGVLRTATVRVFVRTADEARVFVGSDRIASVCRTPTGRIHFNPAE